MTEVQPERDPAAEPDETDLPVTAPAPDREAGDDGQEAPAADPDGYTRVDVTDSAMGGPAQ